MRLPYRVLRKTSMRVAGLQGCAISRHKVARCGAGSFSNLLQSPLRSVLSPESYVAKIEVRGIGSELHTGALIIPRLSWGTLQHVHGSDC